jgi:hypothetical protein
MEGKGGSRYSGKEVAGIEGKGGGRYRGERMKQV